MYVKTCTKKCTVVCSTITARKKKKTGKTEGMLNKIHPFNKMVNHNPKGVFVVTIINRYITQLI